MRTELNAEESLIAFNTQKDKLHKQILRKLGHKFKGQQNRVRERNELDKVFHRWTSKKPLTRYYTSGRDVKTMRDVLQETSPYTLPATSWYRLKEEKKDEAEDPKVKHYQKLTQRGKDSADLLNRVFIPAESKPLPLGICDFNPDYFSLVKGRETTRLSRKTEYLKSMKTTLQQNIMAAIYRDRTKLVNQQFLINFKMVSNLYDYLFDAEETLKAFSYYDENETLKVKNTQKMFWRIYSDNTEIIEMLKRKTASILNDVQYTWDRLLTRLHCKKLLYDISPPSWKKWYDQVKQAWKPEDMESYNALIKQYEDYVAAVGSPDPEISKIMDECKTMYASLGPNHTYYSHMSQVEAVFKDLEGQATLALEYTAMVSNHREILLQLLDETERYYTHEKDILENLIEMLGKKIEDNNKRANELEERLNTKAETWFKDAIVGEDTLMIKSLIQCLYDEIVGQRNRIMTNREMMEQLEAKMIKLKTDIGQIDKGQRQIMSHQLKRREQEALSKAEEAKFKETALKKLIKQMETSMRELPRKKWRDLRPRSKPAFETSQIKSKKKHSISLWTQAVPGKSSHQQHFDIDNEDDEWDCLSYNSAIHVNRRLERPTLRLSDLIDL